MALAYAGRCVRTHQGRDTGDWARKAIVGGGLRHDWFPGNNLGPVEAEVGPRAPPPCPVAVDLSAQRGAIAEVTGHPDPWQALLTPRDCPRRGSAEVGGRAVQRLSQALAVLHLYRTQQESVNVPLGKGYRSVKPSETVGSTKFPSNGDSSSGAKALGDNNAYIAKGFANHGSCLSCRALFPQRMNDKCQHGLWSFRTFKRLIVTNACASPQDGNRYWHHHYSVIKVLHQCRMYGHFKDGKRYSNGSNAVPLPRESNTVYYDILKISPSATHNQIKSAYYKQSLIYHPDKNAGSEEAALRFTQINEAYSVLGSVSLRKKYDRRILTAGNLHMGKRPLEKAQATTPRQSQAKSSPDKFDSGKSKFNFDEFYKAHYGEQLEKAQILRERKLQLRKSKASLEGRWHLNKLAEAAVTVMLIAGFFLLFNIEKK